MALRSTIWSNTTAHCSPDDPVFAVARSLMLERYPDGIEGARIVQKAASSYYPKWIKTATVKKAGGSVRQVLGDDATR
jgi:DNA primase